MTSKDVEETCSGYLRKPHNATPVLYLAYPDGTKQGLCRVCANRWLLSDEEWPPRKITIKVRKHRICFRKRFDQYVLCPKCEEREECGRIEKPTSKDKEPSLPNTEIPT